MDKIYANELVIESRFDRLEYLQDTTSLGADPENLLHALVSAMSDREFHEQYVYLCRMHDIEPDIDKFNGYLELGGYDKAVQGKKYDG